MVTMIVFEENHSTITVAERKNKREGGEVLCQLRRADGMVVLSLRHLPNYTHDCISIFFSF